MTMTPPDPAMFCSAFSASNSSATSSSSAPVMTADELDVALEFEALKALQNMAGSGGVIVMDDATCLVRSLWRVSRFYAEESCGQCTPCREGTPWICLLYTSPSPR